MKLLCVIALFFLALSAVDCSSVRLLKGARPPVDWSLVSSASSSDRVHFFLSLPQRNLAELERRFWAVSNPDSDEYGLFLSVEEIQAIVSPPHSERQVLIDWLVAHGVAESDVLDYGDSLEVDTTTAVASQLFSSDFYVFQHKDGRRAVRAMGDVSIPSEHAGRVEMVYGLTGFPVPHYSSHRRAVSAPGQRIIENDAIIPQSLYSMYGLPRNTTVGTSSGIGQGVIEWEGESFRPIDLLWYASNVSLNGAPVYPADQIIGNDPRSAGGESTLDVDMIVGVAPANTNWFWLETNQSAWLYSFAVHFLNATKVPDVISISYGWYEGDQCENGIGGAECKELNLNSTQFVQRVNTEWMKIGARGVTITVSSGDSGSHTRSDGECEAPTLLADYPASSPYITSVGATEVVNGTYFDPAIAPPACRVRSRGQGFLCISGGTEVAVDVNRAYFTSGGGFSNISAGQSYQSAAVAAYLAQKEVPLPPAAMFNAKGRAYPDVSAVGHNGYTMADGEEELSGGTSQSSPIFAGVLALLSVEYKKITGNTFGFINPLLYRMYAANPQTFTDVVLGDNICTEDGCAKSCKGFRAAKGWDPVTGLGTPNYPSMLAYVMDLAHQVVARRAAKAAPVVSVPEAVHSNVYAHVQA